MTIQRRIITWLDRPGGRTFLAWLVSVYARRLTGADVEVYYDRFWFHRVGAYVFPDGPRFSPKREDIVRWPHQADEYLSNARDYWFQHAPPSPGEVVIDIGAGRGEDVLAFSRAVGATGRVIAVEASPDSFNILGHFCRRNRLDNVTLIHAAVMDRPGTVRLEEGGHWLEHSVRVSDDEGGSIVPALTLDAICEQEAVSTIALLKINIEGAERYALPGMERALAATRTVCVACHDFRAELGHGEEFRTRAFAEPFLTARGFRLASRPDDPRDYVRDHIFGLATGEGRGV